MRVYLIQHGQAKAKDADPARPLTDTGRADTQKVAGLIGPLGLRVRAIWQSGKTRARQTAELFAEAVAAEEGVVQRDGMSPDDDVAPVAEALAHSEGDLMLVGHMPFMAKLAARLLTGSESPRPVAFRNSGVVCLRRSDDGRWQLAWSVPAE